MHLVRVGSTVAIDPQEEGAADVRLPTPTVDEAHEPTAAFPSPWDAVRAWAVDHPRVCLATGALSAKSLMLLLVYLYMGSPPAFLALLSTAWDGTHYLHLARVGYPEGFHVLYAFAPLFPWSVRLLGAGDTAALLVNQAASLGAVLLAREVWGDRRAWFLALFPAWMVFTAMGWSIGLFALLLVASMAALERRRTTLAGALGGLAVLTRYVGGPAMLVASLTLWRRPKEMLRFAAPVGAVGVGIVLWHTIRAGDPLTYTLAQATGWSAGFAFPWTHLRQIIEWTPPAYWLAYLVTLGIVVAGIHQLWKRGEHHAALYSAAVLVLLACTQGSPVKWVPRLALGAVPAIAAVGLLLQSRRAWLGYAGVSIAMGAYATWSVLDIYQQTFT